MSKFPMMFNERGGGGGQRSRSHCTILLAMDVGDRDTSISATAYVEGSSKWPLSMFGV